MIAFRIRFTVKDGRQDEFEEMITGRYQPGLARQRGFVATRLLRVYDADTIAAIDADTVDGADYLLEFEFDSESDRMAWVDGPDHEDLWNAAVELTDARTSCGYHVVP